jgi:hypothetical protein
MPLGTLNGILNFDAVKKHLEEHGSECDQEDIARRVCDGYRKIFAILVLLGKGKMVLDFVNNNINDECLPFTLDKKALTKQEKRVPFLDNLPFRDEKIFDDCQWYMLAPYFAKRKNGTVPLHILHDRTIFPWTRYGEEIKSGFSRVRRVEIHQNHHNLVCI